MLWGCKTDDPKPSNQSTGSLEMELDHLWGHQSSTAIPFSLEKELVHPKTGDTLNFTTFKYYLSNIELQRTSGEWYAIPNSYYLVDLQIKESNTILLNDIPSEDYRAIRFLLGVDSTRNVSGAQEGVLSPSNGMFWSWNTGYIMIKAEGTSPQSPDDTFAFHLGGFKAPYPVQKSVEFDFHHGLTIREGALPRVHLGVYPNKLWMDAESVSAKHKTHMPGEVAHKMSQGFFGTLTLEHLHQ